ncbi:e3 ubiquitin-protein ligase rnf213 [Anaeramoeba ignava]|uniref:E3 ubiquitin-protein ligase rnf213 n=1 Tax=Anaeramoeba ignava TaxID=1746090 RepID=A0A9Q0M0P2_ANAIG|nr:e3 ubiquitin-protein ligase rnf213 [Anaeramoeba ignava]
MGKTYQIHKKFNEEYQKENYLYFNIILSKEISNDFIKDKEKEKKFFHIELPFSPKLETLDFIWGFTMWNLFENKREKSSNFIFDFNQEDLNNCFLAFEIPSNRKENSENGLNHFQSLEYFQEKECQVNYDEFSFIKFKLNPNFIIEKIEDKKLKNVAKLIELSNNNFKQFKNIQIEKRKEFINQEPNKKEFFNLIEKKILQKLPHQPLTFRIIFIICSILKSQIILLQNCQFLDSNQLFKIRTEEEKEEIYEKFISQLFSFYLDSIVNISSRYLKWSTKIEKLETNEFEDFSNLLKDRIDWNQKFFTFPIFLNQLKNQEQLEMIIISNNQIKSLFNQKLENFLNNNILIKIYENFQNDEEKIEIEKEMILKILNSFNSKQDIKEYPKFLTSNNLMKLINIHYRLIAKLPVIFIEGNDYEKNLLIHYLLEEILKQKLIILNINSKTNKKDIEQIIEKAENIIKENPNSKINILFNDFNTGSKECIILLKKILIDRSFDLLNLPKQINLLASIKSFQSKQYSSQIKPNESNESNIIEEIISKPQLIPDSFFEDIYDFGNLNKKGENNYILSMIYQKFPQYLVNIDKEKIIPIILETINFSRNYIQQQNKTNYSIQSLQDVFIFLNIFQWLIEKKICKKLTQEKQDNHDYILQSILLSLFVVYGSYFIGEEKDDFLLNVEENLKKDSETIKIKEIIDKLTKSLIQSIQFNLTKTNLFQNQNLNENGLSILISCFTQIPLLIIGNLEISKKSFQFIFNSFLSSQNKNQNENLISKQWNLPQIKQFEIQCSQIFTQEYLQNQFQNIKQQEEEEEQQQQQQQIIPIIILKDFTNLSKENLIMIHSKTKKIMNKMIYNSNSNPKFTLILLTNTNTNFEISGLTSRNLLLLSNLNKNDLEIVTKEITKTFSKKIRRNYPNIFVELFSKIYQNQNEIISKQFKTILQENQPPLNFYGIKDYQYFLNNIGFYYGNTQKKTQIVDICYESLFRNFGIKSKILNQILENSKIEGFEKLPEFNSFQLIEENIQELSKENEIQTYSDFIKTSRHLMIFIPDISIFSIILQYFSRNSIILFDSNSLIKSESQIENENQEINKILDIIEKCIYEGKMLILLDYQKIYPLLDDLFNQNYIKENEKFYTTIIFENEIKKIEMNPNFRLIIITTKAIKYEFNQPNLLNQFEKQLIDISSFNIPKESISKISKIFNSIKQFTENKIKKEDLIIEFNQNSFSSLILKYQNEKDQEEKIKKKIIQFFKFEKMIEIKELLSKKQIQKVNQIKEEYFSSIYNNFEELLNEEILKNEVKKSIIFTRGYKREIGKIEEKYSEYSFKILDLQNKDKIIKKENEELISNIPKEKNILIIHFKQNQIELFYQIKILIEQIISQNNNQNKIENSYIILFIHLSFTSNSKSFPFYFEKNWEHYYIEEIETLFNLKNLPQNLLESFDYLQKNKQIEKLIIENLGIILSKEKDLTNENFKKEKELIEKNLFKNEEMKEQIFQKIRKMIELSIKSKHENFKWEIFDILQNFKQKKKKKKFISILFDKMKK